MEKYRNLIYIAIAIVCVIAIVIGVYYQLFKTGGNEVTNAVIDDIGSQVVETQKDNPQIIREEFYGIFNNWINTNNMGNAVITKYYEDKDVVYTGFSINREDEGKYSVNLNIPIINIKDSITDEYNGLTQTIFANEANEIFKGINEQAIYNVDYTACVNGNILSVVIKSTLKKGDSAQRVIVQTYNYDMETKQKVSLSNLLEKKNLDEKTVEDKIKEQVKISNDQAIAIGEALGKTVYQRDLSNAMYTVKNASNFYYGENGVIYIIYAYGNSNFTSEIDIVKIK